MRNKKICIFPHCLLRMAALLMAFVMVMGLCTVPVLAGDEPYDTYNYDDREDLTYTPSAYEPLLHRRIYAIRRMAACILQIQGITELLFSTAA